MDDLPLNSIADGIVWPALPDAQGAAILAVLFQLEQTQWWSAARLRRAQHRQAEAVLDHVWRTVPFYRDRLKLAGYSPGKPFPAENWARIPPLSRSEVVAAADGLLSSAPPANHGGLSEIFTSGSTGRPVRAVPGDGGPLRRSW